MSTASSFLYLVTLMSGLALQMAPAVLRDLKGEYDALVGTGALTEVEFWSPRSALLSSHASAALAGAGQQSLPPANPTPVGRVLGISNMMLDMNVGIYLHASIGLLYTTHWFSVASQQSQVCSHTCLSFVHIRVSRTHVLPPLGRPKSTWSSPRRCLHKSLQKDPT